MRLINLQAPLILNVAMNLHRCRRRLRLFNDHLRIYLTVGLPFIQFIFGLKFKKCSKKFSNFTVLQLVDLPCVRMESVIRMALNTNANATKGPQKSAE